MELHQFRDGEWIHVTDATFVMVVRDPLNSGSSFVNPLQIDTEEERLLMERGEKNRWILNLTLR